MKNFQYLLIYFLMSLPLMAFTQNVERTFRPEFFSTPSAIVTYSDNQILISGEGRKEKYGTLVPFLVMLDTLGNVIWEHDFLEDFPNFYEQIVVQDIELEGDDILVKVGASCCCDVGLISYFYRMNAIGEIIENFEIPRFNEKVKYENRYVLRNYSNVYLIDSNYQVLAGSLVHQSVPGYRNTGLIYSPPNLLISSINGGNDCGLIKLEIYDFGPNDFLIMSDCESYNNIQNMEVNDSGIIYIQNDNRIISLDTDLNEIDEVTISSDITITDLKISDNKLLVFTDSSSIKAIRIFEEDLNKINEVTFEEDLKLIPQYAVLKENKLFVTGEERSAHQVAGQNYPYFDGDSRSSIFFRIYQLDEVNVFPFYDIGVTQVSVVENPTTSPSVCFSYQDPDCGTTHRIEYDDVYVTIANNGNTILNSCTINARINACGNCDYFCDQIQTYSMGYENLNLMPGATMEVLFGDIGIDDQQIEQGIHELCLWTANPNNAIDKNISNDQSCLQADVLVDIIALEKESFEVQLFPNPSDGEEVTLNISSENVKKRVTVYDILGEIKATYFLEKDISHLKIKTTNYPTGVYFVSVSSSYFSIDKKMVVN